MVFSHSQDEETFWELISIGDFFNMHFLYLVWSTANRQAGIVWTGLIDVGNVIFNPAETCIL